MARKSKSVIPPSNGEFRTCKGGRSFNCQTVIEEPGVDSRFLGPHQPQREISPRAARNQGPVLAPGGYHCRKCNAYMGCYWCAQRKSELVCLSCNDWALDDGEAEHGRMIHDRQLGSDCLKIVTGIYEGRYTKAEGLKLIAEGFGSV